jgi:hypothetical protein
MLDPPHMVTGSNPSPVNIIIINDDNVGKNLIRTVLSTLNILGTTSKFHTIAMHVNC